VASSLHSQVKGLEQEAESLDSVSGTLQSSPQQQRPPPAQQPPPSQQEDSDASADVGSRWQQLAERLCGLQEQAPPGSPAQINSAAKPKAWN
jgi:hypothetical protein